MHYMPRPRLRIMPAQRGVKLQGGQTRQAVHLCYLPPRNVLDVFKRRFFCPRAAHKSEAACRGDETAILTLYKIFAEMCL